jgi:hypothetical protein
MKTILLATLLLATAITADTITVPCAPTAVAGTNSFFIAYLSDAYKYSLPDLNLQLHKSYNQQLCPPSSFSGSDLVFAGDQLNDNSTKLSSSDLSIIAQSDSPAPNPGLPYECKTIGSDQYCLYYDTGLSYIQRKNGDNVVESIKLPKNDTSAYYLDIDADIPSRLNLITVTSFGRGSTTMTYFGLNINPLTVVYGPKELPNTQGNGCPLPPQQCDVSVVLQISVRNDIVSYIWSILEDNIFKVNVQSYDARCDIIRNVPLADSLAASSRCETGSSSAAPSTGVPSTSAVPSSPASTSSPTTSSSPASSTTTAPGANISGDNNAKEASSAIQVFSAAGLIIAFILYLINL